jgi:predicted acylesterase/phospholipase RssA/CRP-like cAMP-binding protein
MQKEISQLMSLHRCFQGLDENALVDIAKHLTLVHVDANALVHAANTMVTDIYFVTQGSLKLTYVDSRGNERVFRIVSRNEQFGVAAAAMSEPAPVAVHAREPSTFLKLDFSKGQELTSRHARFRLNILASLGSSLRQVFLEKELGTQPLILAVFHSSPETRPLTRRLVRRLAELGERVCVLSDRDSVANGSGATWERLPEMSADELAPAIREHIARWSNAQRIIVDIDAALEPTRASQLIQRVDAVIWCLRPDDYRFTVERLRANNVLATGCRGKISLVWILPDGRPVSPVAPELLDLSARDFKVTVGDPQPGSGKLLTNGIERLVHYLRGVQVGLALGGGAARGMAHLGVLHALEQHGVVVDMIAGTSAGALTGIPYASGMAADHCARCFAADLMPSWPFRILPSGNHLYLLYKYRRGQFDGMLRKYLSDYRLEQLPLPACTITVDLVSGELVVRDRGDAVLAILESINLPVLSTPIVRDGRALVDGGLVNNVPADVLVKRGCNVVFAVSVTAKIERKFAHNRPDTPTSRMRPASTLQTLMRSFLVQNVNLNAVGVSPADYVIEPDVTQFDLTEFGRAKEMAAVGERTALSEVPGIKKLLQSFDERLFAQVTEG